MPTLLVGAVLLTTCSHAIGNAAYQTLRTRFAVTPVPAADQFSTRLRDYAGRVVEMEGTVTGTIEHQNSSGFLLRVPPDQTFVFMSTAEDLDVDITTTLRVLARVPTTGQVLECLAATPLAKSETAPTDAVPAIPASADDTVVVPPICSDTPRASTMPVAPRAPFTIYEAPPFNNAPETPKAPSCDANFTPQPEIVQCYAERIRRYNNRLCEETSGTIAYHLLEKSGRYGLDPRLLFALVLQESRFNPDAVSRAGAQGLGQLMPGTADSLGVQKPFAIDDNLDGAARYLADQLRTFGRLSLALAAYNAGPGNVKKYGGVPPFRETQRYVRIIWNNYCELAGLDPDTGRTVASR